jgi:hypothetical protein
MRYGRSKIGFYFVVLYTGSHTGPPLVMIDESLRVKVGDARHNIEGGRACER